MYLRPPPLKFSQLRPWSDLQTCSRHITDTYPFFLLFSSEWTYHALGISHLFLSFLQKILQSFNHDAFLDTPCSIKKLEWLFFHAAATHFLLKSNMQNSCNKRTNNTVQPPEPPPSGLRVPGEAGIASISLNINSSRSSSISSSLAQGYLTFSLVLKL